MQKPSHSPHQNVPKKGKASSITARLASLFAAAALVACDENPAQSTPSVPFDQKPNSPENQNQTYDHNTLVRINIQKLLGIPYGFIMIDGSYSTKFIIEKEKSYTGTAQDVAFSETMRVNCISYLQYVYDLNNNPILGNAWAAICDRDNYPDDVIRQGESLLSRQLQGKPDIIVGALFDWVYSGRPVELGLIDQYGRIPNKSEFLRKAVEYLEWYEKTFMKAPIGKEGMNIKQRSTCLASLRFTKKNIEKALEYIKIHFIPKPGMTCHVTIGNSHTGTLVNEGEKGIIFYNAGAIGGAPGEKIPREEWRFDGESFYDDLNNRSGKEFSLCVSRNRAEARIGQK